MATLLINKIDAPTIPISSSNIHNPNGVEAGLLKNLLRMNFNNIVCESYNQNKMKWIFVTDMIDLNEDDLIDSLIVHSYDADLIETHSKRSFKFTKLIDFLPQNLKNASDYLKCLDIFFRLNY
jgi:hypothetical protein